MKFDFQHSFDIEEALERVQALCEYLYNRHGIQVSWEGKTGTFDGKYLVVSIQGMMVIEETRIHFDGKDPGLLWRRKATRYLTEKLEMYLDPATPSVELPREKQ